MEKDTHDVVISQDEELIFTLLHWSTNFTVNIIFPSHVCILSPIIIFHKFLTEDEFPDFPAEDDYKPGKELRNHHYICLIKLRGSICLTEGYIF